MVDFKLLIRDSYNRGLDRWLGVRTMEAVRDDAFRADAVVKLTFRDALQYTPTDYLLLWACLRWLRLGPNDVFFDIGCGAGRSLCLAARFPVKKCIGIEFNDHLAEIARSNVATMRGRRAEIEVRVGDAAQTDYSDATAFFLYSPFGERTMAAVVDAIGASLVVSPRNLRIAYLLPDYETPLTRCSWLERYSSKRYPFANSTVSLWRNRRL